MATRSVTGLRRCGSILIETAFLTALLAVLAIGAGDLTSAWRIRTALVMAAREGARIASLVPNLQQNDASASAVIYEVLLGSGLDLSRADRSISFSTPLSIGDPVTATVTYAFQPSAPGLAAAFNGPIPLQANARMPYRGSGALTTGS